MMTRDSRLDMFSYTLKLHTKAHTFVRGRPTQKNVRRAFSERVKPYERQRTIYREQFYTKLTIYYKLKTNPQALSSIYT